MSENKQTQVVFPNVKYGVNEDKLFSFFEEGQFKDAKLWKILVNQFRRKADGKDYGWRGEFWGKLMRSASLCYSYNKDQGLYKVLSKSVDDLISTMDSEGRITTYPKQKELKGWDMWCRKYVMLGLAYFYDICVSENQKQAIKQALTKSADYVIDHVNEGKLCIADTSGLWGGANSFSILQAIVKIYKITKENKYLKYAEYLIKTQNFDGMHFFKTSFEKNIPPYQYPVVKAYEILSCYEGLLEYYEVTKNQTCLKVCVNYVDELLKTDFTILGGTGCRHEYFDNSTARQVIYDPSTEKQETCVTVTLIKFLLQLFVHTKKVSYIDAIEKAFYNIFIGTLNFDYKKNKYPLILSYSPTTCDPRWKQVGGQKKITPTKFYGCCISIAGAGLGCFSKSTAMYIDDSLYINIPTDADYKFETNSGNIEFSVKGGYPDNGKIVIEFSKLNKDCKKIFIRKPDWATDITCQDNNGRVADLNDGYFVFDTDLTSKTDITLNVGMPLKFLNSQDYNPNIDFRVAVTKGPYVLCMNSTKPNFIFNFDMGSDCDKQIDQNGRIFYDVKLTDNSTVKLNRYCDCGKDIIDKQMTNIWFRKK